jgi:hypothetical protein
MKEKRSTAKVRLALSELDKAKEGIELSKQYLDNQVKDLRKTATALLNAKDRTSALLKMKEIKLKEHIIGECVKSISNVIQMKQKIEHGLLIRQTNASTTMYLNAVGELVDKSELAKIDVCIHSYFFFDVI